MKPEDIARAVYVKYPFHGVIGFDQLETFEEGETLRLALLEASEEFLLVMGHYAHQVLSMQDE